MDVLDRLENLVYNVFLVDRLENLSPYGRMQVSIHVIENHIEILVVFSLDTALQFNNVRVILQAVQEHYLIKK